MLAAVPGTLLREGALLFLESGQSQHDPRSITVRVRKKSDRMMQGIGRGLQKTPCILRQGYFEALRVPLVADTGF